MSSVMHVKRTDSSATPHKGFDKILVRNKNFMTFCFFAIKGELDVSLLLGLYILDFYEAYHFFVQPMQKCNSS